MSGVLRFLYLGEDDEFVTKLNDYLLLNIKANFSIVQREYVLGELVGAIAEAGANVVFIDFTDLTSRDDLFKEVLFVRRVTTYRSILFAALLGDSSQSRAQQLLYSLGFQIGHVKGEETKDFFASCLYIGAGKKYPLPEYARARNINKELRIGLCSTLVSISPDYFSIESDLESDSEEISLRLHLFQDLDAEIFKVRSRDELSYVYPMTDSYQVDFPYVTPWGEVSSTTIQKETVETWIDLYSENLIKLKCFILLISENQETYRSIFSIVSSLPIEPDIIGHIDKNISNLLFLKKKPPLIFVDLSETGSVNLDAVAEVINIIGEIDSYKPILVLMNCTSKADALRKAYGYENIVSMPTPFSEEIFSSFIASYLDRKQGEDLDGLYFQPSDELRGIDVFQQVQIASLSEHEIVFFAKPDLPMFSVIHLELPIECFATIVPPFSGRGSNTLGGRYYFGIIHGVSEEEKQVLRKFVNQIIYEPISSFTKEEIEIKLKQKIVKHDKIEQQKEEKKKEEDEMKPFEDDSFHRPPVRGKSKL